MKTRTITKAQLEITKGTVVRYTKDDGSCFLGIARGSPEKLSGHTWVVWLDGIAGCLALDRCEPIKVKPL